MAIKYVSPRQSWCRAFFIGRTPQLSGKHQEEKFMRKILLALATLSLLAGIAQAETTTLDTVVVTATRTETPLSQIGSSVTVITADEIEEKQQTQVLDVLRSVPGVGIIQSGPSGAATSIYLRGTDTRHTLVLIDGIEYRDASSIGGGPKLENLTTDNIERIEIVRGAQSVLYGSDAIGGVISIITKNGSQKPTGSVTLEGGSYNTWKESASISIPSLSFSVSRTESDGFSSYNEDDGFNEDDGYSNLSASLNIDKKLSDLVSVETSLHLTDASYDYDTGYYDYTTWEYLSADTDATTDSKEVAARGALDFNLYDGKWILSAAASTADIDRDTSGTYDNYDYEGTTKKIELLNTILADSKQTVMVGFEAEKENYKSSYGDSGNALNRAAYIQDQINLTPVAVTLGLRVDDHDTFGNEVTWRIAPTYTVPYCGARLKASAGTGFKAPSLFQLYYPYGGNEDLDAETSQSYDLGFEQDLFDNAVTVSASWFYNDIENYINWYDDGDYDYDDGDGYANIEALTTQGVETSVDWYPHEIVSFSLSYTYTDSEDEDGEPKARIPLHQGSFAVNLYPLDEAQLTTSVLYVGEREDTSETLDAYTLVNLSGSYQVCDYAKLFARIENLFDEDYEEVAGYGTAGLSAYAGVKVTF
jgi:vitamin B12 transporter